MDKISIVIPAYNVDKYIDKCLESILNQTYRNVEVIIINDGSTDDTRKICEKFEKKDSRILVINKENSGVSSARNEGLKVATGKYIAFVDSDDWVENNYLEIMYNSMVKNNVDLVMCGRVNEISPTKKFNSSCGLPDGLYKVDEMLSEFICPQKYKIATTPHSKLYKVNLIKGNIQYLEDLKYDEDYIFNLNYLLTADTVMSIGTMFLYHYRTNPSSLTNSYRKDMWINKLKLDEYAKKLIVEDGRESLLYYLNGKLIINAIKTFLNELNHKGYNVAKKYLNNVYDDERLKTAYEKFRESDFSLRERIFSKLVKWKMIFGFYLLMKVGFVLKKFKLRFKLKRGTSI